MKRISQWTICGLILLEGLVAIWIFIERDNVRKYAAGSLALDRLAKGSLSMDLVVGKMRDAALSCLSGSASNGSPKEGIVFTKVKFSETYNRSIDKAAFATVFSDDQMREISKCIEQFLKKDQDLALTSWADLQNNILWIYFFLESSDGQSSFLMWPFYDVPLSYNPKIRPWYLAVRGADDGRILHKELDVEYRDAFTAFPIRSRSIAGDIRSFQLTFAVDHLDLGRATAETIIYILNLLLVVAFGVVSLLAFGISRDKSVYYWAFCFLVWGVLYSFKVIVDVFRLPSAEFLVGLKAPIMVILSILNSGFFLFTAKYVRNRHFKKAFPSALKLTGLVLALAIFLLGVNILIHQYISSPTVLLFFGRGILPQTADAIFALYVTFVLFRLFHWWLLSRMRSNGILKFALGSLVGFFFIIFGLSQVSVPFWSIFPAVELYFLALSPLLKIVLAALFYIGIIIERYWMQTEANQAVLDRLDAGVLGVSKAKFVIAHNKAACVMLDLQPTELRESAVATILFRERYAEFLRIWAELESDGQCGPRRVHLSEFGGLSDLLMRGRLLDDSSDVYAVIELSYV